MDGFKTPPLAHPIPIFELKKNIFKFKILIRTDQRLAAYLPSIESCVANPCITAYKYSNIIHTRLVLY